MLAKHERVQQLRVLTVDIACRTREIGLLMRVERARIGRIIVLVGAQIRRVQVELAGHMRAKITIANVQHRHCRKKIRDNAMREVGVAILAPQNRRLAVHADSTGPGHGRCQVDLKVVAVIRTVIKVQRARRCRTQQQNASACNKCSPANRRQ